ncbi:High-affinity glucose transporter HXT2 [Lasiodiplodia hormozganensis]|uniref:High-affinity glucose transporter HXT2 n=1 Tax=Lasiodiplodia hormozganensis TaxID=869390 RepID=A0AA39YM58_9PEZI|nr:High-affinity glucose transporter HXT2 [Lasiodiplodia hormozganensis]
MNSTPFLGKLIISATTAAQFTVGRILAFGMTGICVISIPAYMAEIAPPSLRGLISSQLQIQIVFSQLVASGINYGTANIPNNNSWRIPVLIQFVMPVFLLTLLPILVESPRWLISRGRQEDAMQALQKLRKNDASVESLQLEIDMLSSFKENEEKGSWREVFQGTNRRRTFIVTIAMIGQQITGQSFASQYSTIFYTQQGFTNAFALSLISTAVTFAGVLISGFFVDGLGRRPLLIGGGLSQAFWLFLLGGMGTIANPTSAQKNTLVASLMLFGVSYGLSWASLSYIILAEAASRRVVEKTNMLAISLSVVTAFVVSFTVPYLVNDGYAGLGARVGFVYGALALLMAALAWLFVPEMKGLELEQLDQLFEARTPTRSFGKVELERLGGEQDKVGAEQLQ